MEHVVFFPAADGTEGFRRAADLEEAVRLVENLRNDQGIGEVSVFALSPVPLAFRTYVHVELPVSDDVPAAEDAPAAPAEPSFETPAEPSIPPPPVEVPEAFQAPELPDLPEPFEAPEAPEAEASFEAPESVELEVPAPPAPPSDFFEPIEDVELPAEPEALEWSNSEADVAWADNEGWSEGESVSDDIWPEPAVAELSELARPDASEPAGVAELTEDPQPAEQQPESDPIAVPDFFASEQELPPLTLAPGPLLFDGDGTPLAAGGSYDLVQEPEAELTDLIPADFTDLIPRDLPHGDLARHTDEAPAEAPYQEPVAQAPTTDELPPIDVAEIPSDVSSIEAFESTSIPAAREAVEAPAPAHDGPRGLGFFGG